jgi:hypothetical protein
MREGYRKAYELLNAGMESVCEDRDVLKHRARELEAERDLLAAKAVALEAKVESMRAKPCAPETELTIDPDDYPLF